MAEFDFIGLPLKELNKIQEALKPLGYEIHGYRDERCSKEGIVLYLAQYFPEPHTDG